MRTSISRRFFGVAAGDADAFSRIVHARCSALSFDPQRGIPRETRDTLLRLAQRAPSGFNAQPYVMVVAQSTESRARLAAAMVGGANAARVLHAPLSVVFAADTQAARTLGDLQRLERQAGKGARYLRSLETDLAVFSSYSGSGVEDAVKAAALRAGQAAGSLLPSVNSAEAWAFKNAALAAQTLLLGAAAHGLASCAMEGLDAHRVRRALAIPERYGIALVVAVGHAPPATGDAAPPRPLSPRFALRDAARLDSFDCPLDDTNDSAASPAGPPSSA